MACDHIDFEIYTVLQVTHNRNNSIVFCKVKCTSMADDHIDFKYIYITDSKSGNTYHNINNYT